MGFIRLACTFLVIIILSICVFADSNIDPVDKWAWGTNIGWINFAPQNGGVCVYRDHLEGYAWGENVGWIRMGTYEGGDEHTYENSAPTNYGVNRDHNGFLSGYAWGTNIGWINFAPEHGGVRINPQTNEFEGDAWGENVGWIRFKGDGYLVLFTGFPPVPIPPSGSGSNLLPIPDAGPDQTVCVGERAILDGSRSHDGEAAAPATALHAQNVSNLESDLSYRWTFSIRYMAAGVPVYMIPGGSNCFASCRGFDQPIASFIPDVEGDYTLTLYVTDVGGETTFDQTVVTAVFDPAFIPEEPDSESLDVEQIVCFPNPFSGQISFGFVGTGTPDQIDVSVFDLCGHPVWQGSISDATHLLWDGTAPSGDRLPNGGYICIVVIRGNGTITSEKAVVVIRR